uniref:Uncharacterized protein n=1 Tax=viral metagenome TaxID=1070528 RepID=A0A6C0JXF5_9ZZZZ
MKTNFTYRRRKINTKRTRRVQRGGDGGPVNTQALLSIIAINGQNLINILTANGTIGPIQTILINLRDIIFDPVVSAELTTAIISLKDNPELASTILNIIASTGSSALSEPQFIQFLQTMHSQYIMLTKPGVQDVLKKVYEKLISGLAYQNLVQAILKSGAAFLTNILQNNSINVRMNNIIQNMSSIVAQPVVQNAINNTAQTSQISSGPSPTTTAGATTTLAAQQAAASTGITSPSPQALGL